MEEASLSELLKEGWKIQGQVESGEITPSNNKEFKVIVNKGIEQLTEAQRRVNSMGLYSSNEDIDEIATADLKFMIIPALLGDLLFQVIDGDRLQILHRSKDHFSEYLQRCYDYALTTEPPPTVGEEDRDESSSGNRRQQQQTKTMEQLSAERKSKITRFKAQREMEKKVAQLKGLIEGSEFEGQRSVDDEVLREHIISNLKLWIFKSIDYIGSIRQEIELLTNRSRPSQPLPPPPQGATPLKPVVITREMLKGKVFGAGYPSLPTMTVEEFYEKTYMQQQNKDSDSSKSLPNAATDREEEGEEKESDDEEELRKAREFDEYKDDHRRGWGNRTNMG